MPIMANPDLMTFPKLLLQHAAKRPQRTAIREKAYGIWQSYTWQQVYEQVAQLAAGLAKQGFQRGQNFVVIGDNRPRLYWGMLAAQSLGGIAVPLYQDAVASEMQYVLQETEAVFVLAENQEQVDKLLEVMTACPSLRCIIYDDPRGLRLYQQSNLLAYTHISELGKKQTDLLTWFDQQVHLGKPDDVAVILYTSGTTGKPKGVCQTHRSCIVMAHTDCLFDGLDEADEVMSYLPMAWVGDYLFSYAQALVAGYAVNCPESPTTVMADLCEIGPTYYFAPPRIYENILTQVMIRIEDATWVKRKIFHYFIDLAKQVGIRILEKKPVSICERFQYAIGQLLIYGPLKNVLGLSRVRLAYTGGEAIGPDLFIFYRSLGINLKQLYGSTETFVSVCMHPNGHVKLDSVGVPMKGVEIKISSDGEVLVRSPGLLHSYYKNPEATLEAINSEGYFATGDAGLFDADGQLRIIDRAKDVGRLMGGALFAPKYVENKLKFFPYIKEAVAFGDRRHEVCAMINIDFEACGNWAERRGIAYTGYADLARQEIICKLVQECVEKVNLDLSNDPILGGTQVHRFVVLHKELDPDDGELTRTRKVRRRFIAEKYTVLIDALYGEKTDCYIETQVHFEDGSSGMISATLKIYDATVFTCLAVRQGTSTKRMVA